MRIRTKAPSEAQKAIQSAQLEELPRPANLTLLTSKLNTDVSIGPWIGDSGKAHRLEAHDIISEPQLLKRLMIIGVTRTRCAIR